MLFDQLIKKDGQIEYKVINTAQEYLPLAPNRKLLMPQLCLCVLILNMQNIKSKLLVNNTQWVYLNLILCNVCIVNKKDRLKMVKVKNHKQ